MNIAITSKGPDLDSPVDPRFGRCQYFLIVNNKGKLLEAVANSGVKAQRGAGITAAQTIANKKAEAVITGNIGPNAFGVLQQTGIKIFMSPAGISCSQAFDQYKQGKLNSAQTARPYGRGSGWGRGLGNRRGGGRGQVL